LGEFEVIIRQASQNAGRLISRRCSITLPKEDVYTAWELIYLFQIKVVPVPVAETYHPVEGGETES
jgi:hypothetical protein